MAWGFSTWEFNSWENFGKVGVWWLVICGRSSLIPKFKFWFLKFEFCFEKEEVCSWVDEGAQGEVFSTVIFLAHLILSDSLSKWFWWAQSCSHFYRFFQASWGAISFQKYSSNSPNFTLGLGMFRRRVMKEKSIFV